MVTGDGDRWIQALAKNLNSYYILDKFHAYKVLNLAFKNRKNKVKDYSLACEFFSKGQYNNLINFLLDNKVKNNYLNFFKNLENGIINQNKDWNIGCFAESTVYHLVKSSVSGAKIYSFSHFLNIINKTCYNVNNKIN